MNDVSFFLLPHGLAIGGEQVVIHRGRLDEAAFTQQRVGSRRRITGFIPHPQDMKGVPRCIADAVTSHPSYRELTRDSYTRRLAGQGLREEVVGSFLDQYADVLFAPHELIVLAHFSRDAIDEAVLLDVFPAPKKLVRTAALVIVICGLT